MELLRNIILGMHVIICLALIIITMIQSKNDAGLSGALTGGTNNDNFLDKNKGRTKEGKLKKWTIILAVAFVIFTIALSIMYVI